MDDNNLCLCSYYSSNANNYEFIFDVDVINIHNSPNRNNSSTVIELSKVRNLFVKYTLSKKTILNRSNIKAIWVSLLKSRVISATKKTEYLKSQYEASNKTLNKLTSLIEKSGV